MIKVLIFDQAKVQTHNVFSRTGTNTVLGKEVSLKNIGDIYYSKYYKDFNIGTIDEKTIITSFLEENKYDLTYEEFVQIYKDEIYTIEGIEDILKKASMKYELITLINEGKEWAHYKLDVSGFKKYFKRIFISGEMGIAKPDTKIYLEVLREIQAKPEECVFIDDRKENCVAAEKLGIKSIVFKDANQLLKEFQKLHIELE